MARTSINLGPRLFNNRNTESIVKLLIFLNQLNAVDFSETRYRFTFFFLLKGFGIV